MNRCPSLSGWNSRGVKPLPHSSPWIEMWEGLYAPTIVAQLRRRAFAARPVRRPRVERPAHLSPGVRGRLAAHALAARGDSGRGIGVHGARHADALVLLGPRQFDLRGADDQPEGRGGRGDDQLPREQRHQPDASARLARAAVGTAGDPGGGKGKKLPRARARPAPDKGGTEHQITRLSLLLTLTAVLFFSGAVWLLGRDGSLNQTDGIVLIGLFLFWQCFQVFDVLKYNVRQKVRFGIMFYLDVVTVLACAYLMYEAIDWLVTWLSAQKHGFFSRDHLGWLTGWLMVLPNAVLALYWGWRRRPDVVYSSQVGDGHICIPLCLGLFAVMQPMPVPPIGSQALIILLLSAALHGSLLITHGGLPRWAGGLLTLAYGWFVYAGLLA